MCPDCEACGLKKNGLMSDCIMLRCEIVLFFKESVM